LSFQSFAVKNNEENFMKKPLLFYICSLLLAQNAFANANQNEYLYLDELALSAGTDKASNCHNYTEIYVRYFAPLKDKPIKLLEIGIYNGDSVKLWEEYFQKAELHFVDITYQHINYFSRRAHYHIANQESVSDLQMLMKKTSGNFDIIIDDGGHTMTQQITSFKCLFPHVKSKGLYIIEDLHTSYWEGHYGGGSHPNTTIAFLKGLIDDVNFVGARTGRANHSNIDPSISKELNLYRTQIESIHFYDSVAIILKR
jgi:hypothetical protein